MNCEFLNLKEFNKSEISPLFIDEVYFYIIERKNLLKFIEKDGIFLNEKGKVVYQKTFEYVRIFSKLNQKKTINMRKIIDEIISGKKNEFLVHLEIQFVICKIIDLMPITIEETTVLAPRFAEFFTFKESKLLLKKILNLFEE